MNNASRWRMELGRLMAQGYIANPKTAVVMVAGSTGRGTADHHSDLEIDVYYHESPTVDERKAMAQATGATLLDFDHDEDEWAEEVSFGGFHAATSTFLVSTMERYLREVLDEFSTGENPQMRLYSVLHAQTVQGHDLAQPWQARAAAYPDELVRAMLRENLVFDGFGYAEDMLAARDDLLALYDVFVRVERQILGALLGLNRIYLPNSRFKSMPEIIAEMDLKPKALSRRLKGAFHARPAEGVRTLHAVIEEVFELVQRHVADLDVDPYREKMRQRRGVWDAPPRGMKVTLPGRARR